MFRSLDPSDAPVTATREEGRWAERLRAAIAEGRLLVYSQPIVSLPSCRPVQQELLVRMRDEEGKLLPPAEFLPQVERHGLMPVIDRHMIDPALGLLARGESVSVNLPAGSIDDAELLHYLRRRLRERGASRPAVGGDHGDGGHRRPRCRPGALRSA